MTSLDSQEERTGEEIKSRLLAGRPRAVTRSHPHVAKLIPVPVPAGVR